MKTLSKGSVNVQVEDALYEDYQFAVLKIEDIFSAADEIDGRIPCTISRSSIPNSIGLAFDLNHVGVLDSFMRDRMVERWNAMLRKDVKLKMKSQDVLYMGAFYYLELQRAAFRHSDIHKRLLRSGVPFEHPDDGRIVQHITFPDQQTADLLVEMLQMEHV